MAMGGSTINPPSQETAVSSQYLLSLAMACCSDANFDNPPNELVFGTLSANMGAPMPQTGILPYTAASDHIFSLVFAFCILCRVVFLPTLPKPPS